MHQRSLYLLLSFLLAHTATAVRKSCGLGTFLSGNQCTPCPPGTYQPRLNSTTCTPCPAGTYNSFPGAQGLDLCAECPEGTFSRLRGAITADACKKCPDGLDSHAGSPKCITCPPGRYIEPCDPYEDGQDYFAHFGRCSTCGGGVDYFCMLQGPVRPKCARCPFSGVARKVNTLFCEECPQGSYLSRNGKECRPEKNCPPGEQSMGGVCRKCWNFYFNDGTQRTCRSCPLGFQAEMEKGATKCVPCANGTFRGDEYSRTCIACKAGENSFVTGAQICQPDKVPCPATFFQTKEGLCLKCSVHEWLDKANEKCVSCPENQISKGGMATKCKKCPRGMVPMRSGCVCQPGWGVKKGSGGKRCHICPAGTYQSYDNFPTCEKCRIGLHAPTKGMQRCIRCPRGTFAIFPGTKKCGPGPPCPTGLIRSEHAGCVLPTTNCPPNHKRTLPDCYIIEGCVPTCTEE